MISFYLTNANRQTSSIVMYVSFKGKRYTTYIGESVAPSLWLTRKQRVKEGAGDLSAELLNDRLNKWRNAGELTINYFKDKHYLPSKEEFTQVLDRMRHGGMSASEHTSVADYFDTFCKRYRGQVSDGRYKHYTLTKNILLKYQAYSRKVYYFEDLGMDFYSSFQRWCFDTQGYSSNYFGSIIRILKRVSDEAKTDGVHSSSCIEAKGFSAPEEAVDNIYLTEDELIAMHRFKITNQVVLEDNPNLDEWMIDKRTKSLNKAKDLFLISAFTGLRYSDASRLKDWNIADGTISIKTQKTGARVVIPLHWVVKEIIDNGYDFNERVSDVHLNIQIKEVARLVGMTEPVTLTRNKSGKEIELTLPKYLWVTSHTARRSFATNAYKAGLPTIAIMKITGHTREATFLRYIKVSEDENAEMLKMHSFFSKPSDITALEIAEQSAEKNAEKT